MDMALSPKTGILSNSVFTKTEKAICFASVKEPVTAYSNRLPGTVGLLLISNPEILQAVDFRLVVFKYMTCT